MSTFCPPRRRQKVLSGLSIDDRAEFTERAEIEEWYLSPGDEVDDGGSQWEAAREGVMLRKISRLLARRSWREYCVRNELGLGWHGMA